MTAERIVLLIIDALMASAVVWWLAACARALRNEHAQAKSPLSSEPSPIGRRGIAGALLVLACIALVLGSLAVLLTHPIS